MIDYTQLPKSPGCYLFKNKSKNIIYIGKAKNILKRVKSYFQKKKLDSKTSALVKNITAVDFIATDSEIEALILENNLIKKYKPKYNIDLKDSKKYAYLKITDEKFPRVIISRTITDNGKYFGPFTSAQEREFVFELIKKSFKLRTCKKLPKKECLRYHIGLCSAPCTLKISEKEYQNDINKAILVLKGKNSELIDSLKNKLKTHSKEKEYEKALTLRDQISAIEYLDNKQKMELHKKYNEDIINFQIKNSKVYLLLFNIFKGILENKQEFEFDYTENFLEEFLTRFYSENKVPKQVIIPKKTDNIIEEFLTKQKKSNVKVIVPKKGAKKELLELVKKNVELSFFKEEKKLEDLKNALRLNEIPAVIECIDISHLAGTNTVGSLVQFRNGKADKSNYRRFKIKTVDDIDDFKSIAEVVKRRYSRIKKEKTKMPNLIVIDGGKGQLSVALNEIQKLNLKIPIISLAKRLEEIYIPGRKTPLQLDKKRSAIMLLREIRDEAHRFAITYHKLLRKRDVRK